eukprot:TRINITY_DN13032_c0_g1_i1.p1 TRINITY_DN13032_c0_g1~~TRINITY_DN13032_c0_g1_i1.p1  ORF type:complete len:784 (+),score=264.18 TRINITY_DN13032_c0_g1_i1:138-2489(+)
MAGGADADEGGWRAFDSDAESDEHADLSTTCMGAPPPLPFQDARRASCASPRGGGRRASAQVFGLAGSPRLLPRLGGRAGELGSPSAGRRPASPLQPSDPTRARVLLLQKDAHGVVGCEFTGAGRVVSVVRGSPAAAAGLRPGHIIRSILFTPPAEAAGEDARRAAVRDAFRAAPVDSFPVVVAVPRAAWEDPPHAAAEWLPPDAPDPPAARRLAAAAFFSMYDGPRAASAHAFITEWEAVHPAPDPSAGLAALAKQLCDDYDVRGAAAVADWQLGTRSLGVARYVLSRFLDAHAAALAAQDRDAARLLQDGVEEVEARAAAAGGDAFSHTLAARRCVLFNYCRLVGTPFGPWYSDTPQALAPQLFAAASAAPAAAAAAAVAAAAAAVGNGGGAAAAAPLLPVPVVTARGILVDAEGGGSAGATTTCDDASWSRPSTGRLDAGRRLSVGGGQEAGAPAPHGSPGAAPASRQSTPMLPASRKLLQQASPKPDAASPFSLAPKTRRREAAAGDLQAAALPDAAARRPPAIDVNSASSSDNENAAAEGSPAAREAERAIMRWDGRWGGSACSEQLRRVRQARAACKGAGGSLREGQLVAEREELCLAVMYLRGRLAAAEDECSALRRGAGAAPAAGGTVVEALRAEVVAHTQQALALEAENARLRSELSAAKGGGRGAAEDNATASTGVQSRTRSDLLDESTEAALRASFDEASQELVRHSRELVELKTRHTWALTILDRLGLAAELDSLAALDALPPTLVRAVKRHCDAMEVTDALSQRFASHAD